VGEATEKARRGRDCLAPWTNAAAAACGGTAWPTPVAMTCRLASSVPSAAPLLLLLLLFLLLRCQCHRAGAATDFRGSSMDGRA
jgi:hypothetical protein